MKMSILLLLISSAAGQFGFGNMFGNQPGIQMANNQPQNGFGFGNFGNGGIEMGQGQQGKPSSVDYGTILSSRIPGIWKSLWRCFSGSPNAKYGWHARV